MKITVVIPAYNAARTIRATVDSVLRQTLAPDEILVVDDGSTDETAALLQLYGRSIRLIQQENKGAASARNLAYREARGELIAWLDADDIWHPEYLETQARALDARPDLAASFTAHVDLYGYGAHKWPSSVLRDAPLTVIEPLNFLKLYHAQTGACVSPSFLCVRKHVLEAIGDEPFKGRAAEDMYLCTWLPLLGGSIGYVPAQLGAYRITQGSMSSDSVRASLDAAQVFEDMAPHYKQKASPELLSAFNSAFEARRRHYAKLLMGVGQAAEARKQLRIGLSKSHPASTAKCLALLFATYMPRRLQPAWPSPQRDWRAPITEAKRESRELIGLNR